MSQSQKNKRHLYNGQNRMRNQNRKINRSTPPSSRKARRAVMQMIINIANQKNRRSRRRTKHAKRVTRDRALANQRVTENQKNRARQIERGVQFGHRPHYGAVLRRAGFVLGTWLAGAWHPARKISVIIGK